MATSAKTTSAKTVEKPVKTKSAPAKSSAKAADKPAVKKTTTKVEKPVAAKAAKPAARGKQATGTTLTAEQRRCYVEVAAYYMAERRGFAGDPLQNWIEAETEIERLLREGILKP